jgi:fatty acid desaturase
MAAEVLTTPDVDLLPKTEVPAAYRETLVRLGFPTEKLRALGRIRHRRTLADFALTAASLAAVPLLYRAFPHPLTFVLSFVLSIRTFNCLAQLVHTSDHGGLFRNPRFNRLAGNVGAYCLGFTRTGHRLTHLNHHLYLNTVNDPDRIWGAPEQTARELGRMWLRDFLLVSAAARLLQYSQSDRRTFSAAPWKQLSLLFLLRGVLQMWPVVVTQALILSYYTLILGSGYYLLLYLLPIVTFYPAQIRLRSTVEHGFEAGFQPKSPQEYWVVRSTRGAWLERFVFSPFGIHYHFEHHLFPAIPHYNLRRVHKLLVKSGFPVPIAPSYIGFVLQKVRAERVAIPAATAV